jgi:hypothetical protein
MPGRYSAATAVGALLALAVAAFAYVTLFAAWKPRPSGRGRKRRSLPSLSQVDARLST